MSIQLGKGQQLIFIVAPGEGNRPLADYLHKSKRISSGALKRIKNRGIARVNGKDALLKEIIQAGDEVELVYPPEEASIYLQPEFVALDVIYEDDNVLVLNKQAGICVHPTKGHPRQTLANGILYHWAENPHNYRVHLINRLDKDTSGLVLVAKHSYEAQQLFAEQQKDGIERAYLALVEGVITAEEGIMDDSIARVEGKTTKRFVASHGQRALTSFKVRERFAGHTLLELALETGRTHQIRVHLSHFGHPVVGDRLYGWGLERYADMSKDAYMDMDMDTDAGRGANRDSVGLGAGRQLLHAYRLGFTHPFTQQRMGYTVELPEDMQNIINKLRK